MPRASVVTIVLMLRHRPIDSALMSLALASLLSACSLIDFRSAPSEPPVKQDGTAVERPESVVPGLAEDASELADITDAMPVADTWESLASEFTWTVPDNASVSKAIRVFTERPENFQRASRRAEPYLWHIAQQLKTRSLPAELALLPLIESGFRAHVVSPVGAAGLWQFMPATGRRYGLEQTVWYDDRRDILSATRAALDYLTDLHANFDGDWLLALAAYNCGPSRVRRAMQQHQSRDFWTISSELPSETRQYVPKILAAISIVSDPRGRGVTLHSIINTRWFEEIDLGKPIDLTRLIKDTGWSEISFSRLNPGFLRTYTDPDGPFRVLVPAHLRAEIAESIDQVPDQSRVTARMHNVSAGETLSSIAQQYGTTIASLKSANEIDGTLIKISQELLVLGPFAKQIADYETSPSHHTVAKGESLWSIASRYGLSHGRLAARNKLPLGVVLQPGQRLIIDHKTNNSTYNVVSGDSLWAIARKFNVTVRDLRRWNNLHTHETLQPGQSLIVIKPAADSV